MANPSLTELLKRRVDALHEAAHAVVATGLGCRVTSVELIQDEPHVRGRCTYEGPDKDKDRSFREAVIGLAGVLGTTNVWPDERRASRSDLEDWEKLPEDEQSKAVRVADILLSDNWDQVWRLAWELLAHDRLTDQDPVLTSLLDF